MALSTTKVIIIVTALIISIVAFAFLAFSSFNLISLTTTAPGNGEGCTQSLVGMSITSKTIVWDLAEDGDYYRSSQKDSLVKSLLGNFSQMTITDSVNVVGAYNDVYRYNMTVVGTPANGSGEYEATFQESVVPSIPAEIIPPMSIWFLPNGTQVKVSSTNSSLTNDQLLQNALLYLYPFEQIVQEGMLRNQTSPYPSTYFATSGKVQAIGRLRVNVTDYSATSSYLTWLNSCPIRRGNYTSIVDNIGLIPGTNANISTNLTIDYSQPGSVTESFTVVSLKPLQ